MMKGHHELMLHNAVAVGTSLSVAYLLSYTGTSLMYNADSRYQLTL